MSGVEKIRITDRATWLAMRRQDVTASDVPAVCGISRFKTPLRVYAEKAGLIGEEAETAIMRRGRWFEAAAIEAIRDQRPDWRVVRSKVYLRDPERRIGATPDALGEEKESPGLINLQTKVIARAEFIAEWLVGDHDPFGPLPRDAEVVAPIDYQVQTLTEAKLAGAASAFIVPLIVDQYRAEVRFVPVPLHDGAWARVQAEAQAFWRNIAEGRMPAPQGASDIETLRRMYDRVRHRDEPLDLSGDADLAEMLNERKALKREVSRAYERINAIEAQILARVQDAPRAVLPGWQIKYRHEERKAVTVPASRSRVLRIHEVKDAIYEPE